MPGLSRAARPLAAIPAAALAACAVVGPEYERAEPVLPQAYEAVLPPLFETGAGVDPWWTLFDDRILEGLVERGLDANLDVRVAASRVREARAIARGVEAERAVQVDAGGEGEAELRGASGGEEADGLSVGATGFLAGALEIDLFGRLLRSRQAAWARAERAQALERESRRLAVGEIARAYVELRAAERRLALTRESLELQRRTLELVTTRVTAGLSPGLDQTRAQAAVSTLEADLGPLSAQVGRFRHALAVLLGETPGSLAETLAESRPVPRARVGAAIGVPADLVRRRPDLQAAELAIVAATADVGVEVADLYPRLTLPGRIEVGRTGLGAGDVVTAAVATLSPLVSVPISDGGLRRAEITAAEERVVQATLGYRDTLLAAVQAVEAALLDYRGAFDRRRALEAAVESNRVAYEQSQALYREGLVTFIDVLDSQRAWNTSLQQLAEAERDLGVALVDLYTALGGAGTGRGGARGEA